MFLVGFLMSCLDLRRIQWNLNGLCKIQQDFRCLSRIQQDFIGHSRILEVLAGFSGILEGLAGSQRFQEDFMGFQRSQQDFRGLSRIWQEVRGRSKIVAVLVENLRGWDLSSIQQDFKSFRFQRSAGFSRILEVQAGSYNQEDLSRILRS